MPVVGYATPAQYQAMPMGVAAAWRDGALIACSTNAVLPSHCCAKCGRPADGKPLRKRFTWHPGAYYLLILIGVLIYLIVALIVSKKATVVIPLCSQHRKRRSTMILTAWLLLAAGIGAMFYAFSLRNVPAELILGGIGAMLVSAIVAIVGTQTISPKRIDDFYAWYRGASREYLAGLPSVPGT
jgi:hypothetical protein